MSRLLGKERGSGPEVADHLQVFSAGKGGYRRPKKTSTCGRSTFLPSPINRLQLDGG